MIQLKNYEDNAALIKAIEGALYLLTFSKERWKNKKKNDFSVFKSLLIQDCEAREMHFIKVSDTLNSLKLRYLVQGKIEIANINTNKRSSVYTLTTSN